MITRKGQKESAIVFSSRKLGEKRGCESQAGPVPPSVLQHPFCSSAFSSLKHPPIQHLTQPYRPSNQGEFPSSPGRRVSVVSIFSRYHFPFLIVLFLSLSLFSSFRTGEAPDTGHAPGLTILSRHRHVSPV